MLIALDDDRSPTVPESAWVAPTAVLVGSVELGEGASVFYGAVLRAERETVIVGRRSNVQDNCVFHVDEGHPIHIGEGVTVGHGAVIHGATIDDGVLIGMGSTVMNGAHVGRESLVAAGAVLPEGAVVPPRSLVAGVPAKVRRALTDAEVEQVRSAARIYEDLRELHRAAGIIA